MFSWRPLVVYCILSHSLPVPEYMQERPFRPPMLPPPQQSSAVLGSTLRHHLRTSQKGTWCQAPRRVSECLYLRGKASPGVCRYETTEVGGYLSKSWG